jgi:hypothetical protein
VRVDLQPARQPGVRRLDRRAVVEHPAPAERVDDERCAQVTAVGVDHVARPPVHLRRLELGVAPVEEQPAEAPVVERREREGQLPAERPVARVDHEIAERLLDRRREAEVLEPLRGCGARRRLALPDLIAIDHEDPRAGRMVRELTGDREAGEARTAHEDVRVGVQRGAQIAPLCGPDRHRRPRIEKPGRRYPLP